MVKQVLADIEPELYGKYANICGVDEAGRGPLAGAVYAAAVIFPRGVAIEGLADSKKLSEKKREVLFDVIRDVAVSYSVAWAEVREIEELNILNASLLAMERAVNGLLIRADFALIDGNTSKGISTANLCVTGGDGKYACIAAASVLAKVSRDRYMRELAERYPQYAFERHKGYGTKLHYERLREHGISEVHRRSFLKRLVLR